MRYSGPSPTMMRANITLYTTVMMTVVYEELAKSNIAQPNISRVGARGVVVNTVLLVNAAECAILIQNRRPGLDISRRFGLPGIEPDQQCAR